MTKILGTHSMPSRAGSGPSAIPLHTRVSRQLFPAAGGRSCWAAPTREPHELLGGHAVHMHLHGRDGPDLAQGLQMETAVSSDLRALWEV